MKDIKFSSSTPFTSGMKHIPDISQDLRKAVIKALIDTAKEFSKDEINYIRSKINKKVEQVKTNSTFWIREIADGYNALYQWFEQELKNKDNIETVIIREAGSCLFYFINPFDVIPDYDIQFGYADDALALNYTLRNLQKAGHRIGNE